MTMRSAVPSSALLITALLGVLSHCPAISSRAEAGELDPCTIRFWITQLADTPGFRWSASTCGSVPGPRAGTVMFEDDQPVLYVTGCFTQAIDQPVGSVARWDGQTWSTVGSPPSGRGRAIAAWREGGTTHLAVAGEFGSPQVWSVHHFDGNSWAPLGEGPAGTFNGSVYAVARHDDGAGPQVVVGGAFTNAGGASASRVARWTGTSWTGLGSGVNALVSALVSADLGDGPRLICGGSFTTAGGAPAQRLARWNGSSWSGLGGGANAPVHALAIHDDGNGPSLWAGGSFSTIGGLPLPRLARWTGSTWDAPAGDPGATVDGLASALFDGQPALLVARDQPFAWTAGSWNSLGTISGSSGTNRLAGFAVAAEPSPTVAMLGDFNFADQVYSPGVALWAASPEGPGWRPAGGREGGFGADYGVWDLLAREVDAEFELLLAGGFTRVGGVYAPAVARWTPRGFDHLGAGASWSPVGNAFVLTKWPETGGRDILAGGRFAPWSPAGDSAVGLASFDGQAWSPFAVVSSPAAGSALGVRAVAGFDDGTGPALFVAGTFSSIDGVPAANIARFDGHAWQALGSGVNDHVMALEVFDDGTGPALYAGGYFTQAGGQIVNRVARWDGESWSAVGDGSSPMARPEALTTGSVFALRAFDDGSGPALYAGGFSLGGAGWPGSGLHRWNGKAWSQVGTSPIVGTIHTLEPWNDGGVTKLVVAGDFSLFFGAGVYLWDVTAWDGQGWTQFLGSNVTMNGAANGSWRAMAPLPDGRLVGGGYFGYTGTAQALFLSVFGPWRTPFVASSPADAVVRIGTTVTLDAWVGILPASTQIKFEWSRDGEVLVDGPGVSGATTAALTLTDIAFGDAGDYVLTCTAPCGSSQSLPAQLIVTCAADLDLDGAITGADLGRMLAAWGSGDAGNDVNSDGVVDAEDLAALLSEWEGCVEE